MEPSGDQLSHRSGNLPAEIKQYDIKGSKMTGFVFTLTQFFEDRGIRTHRNMLYPKNMEAFAIHVLGNTGNFFGR